MNHSSNSFNISTDPPLMRWPTKTWILDLPYDFERGFNVLRQADVDWDSDQVILKKTLFVLIGIIEEGGMFVILILIFSVNFSHMRKRNF